MTYDNKVEKYLRDAAAVNLAILAILLAAWFGAARGEGPVLSIPEERVAQLYIDLTLGANREGGRNFDKLRKWVGGSEVDVYLLPEDTIFNKGTARHQEIQGELQEAVAQVAQYDTRNLIVVSETEIMSRLNSGRIKNPNFFEGTILIHIGSAQESRSRAIKSLQATMPDVARQYDEISKIYKSLGRPVCFFAVTSGTGNIDEVSRAWIFAEDSDGNVNCFVRELIRTWGFMELLPGSVKSVFNIDKNGEYISALDEFWIKLQQSDNVHAGMVEAELLAAAMATLRGKAPDTRAEH